MHGEGSISVRPMRLSGGKSAAVSVQITFLTILLRANVASFILDFRDIRKERERKREHFEFSLFLHDGVKNS